MAFRILDNMDASPQDIATIITAIGNHDEGTAYPVNPIAAALILADKSDVRRNRVRNKVPETFDKHDRVNYAALSSKLHIDRHKKSHNHINAVMRRLIKHAERTNPRDLCDLLIVVSREWLLDHTATYDSDLAQKLEIEDPCGGYDKQLVTMLDTLVFRNRPTHAAFSKEINVALRRATSEARMCFARLSTVQRRVFSLIITGINTPGIAETLGISTNTVKTHRTAIYRKMEVCSLVELIHKAGLLRKERPIGAEN